MQISQKHKVFGGFAVPRRGRGNNLSEPLENERFLCYNKV